MLEDPKSAQFYAQAPQPGQQHYQDVHITPYNTYLQPNLAQQQPFPHQYSPLVNLQNMVCNLDFLQLLIKLTLFFVVPAMATLLRWRWPHTHQRDGGRQLWRWWRHIATSTLDASSTASGQSHRECGNRCTTTYANTVRSRCAQAHPNGWCILRKVKTFIKWIFL